MITPVEIQSKTFKSGGLGYDKKDVDAFFREVKTSFESCYRENLEMKDRIENLNQAVLYYKSIEKTLQKALVLAEKTAEDTKTVAVEKANAIVNEAHTKASQIIQDAKNELEHFQAQTVALLQQYEKYKLQFKNLAASQLELLENECFDLNIARLDSLIETARTCQTVKEEAAATKEDSITKEHNEEASIDGNASDDAFDFISLTEEEEKE